MEKENIPLSEQELLYDPMFAKNPNSLIEDDPSKGFLGKIALKKAAFILVLVFFICLSMYFSFRTVSKNVYTFEESGVFENGDTAYMLTEYHGDSREVLIIDFVRNEKDVPDNSKKIKEIRKYAVNCNESLSLIYIADSVEIIDAKAFYTCKNLKAFIVDENNPNYKSVDGVLYRCENGIPVEIMFFPVKNPEYRAALNLGLEAPIDSADSKAFLVKFRDLENEKEIEQEDGSLKNSLQKETENNTSAFVIPDTVTAINELCFAECHSLRNITINNNITDIEALAFFKCYNLQELNIPNSVISIGSDAFSYCHAITDIFIPASVKTIGHHAFYDCSAVENVRMECSESEAEEMNLGSAWRPERRKVVMRPIEVLYNEERAVK